MHQIKVPDNHPLYVLQEEHEQVLQRAGHFVGLIDDAVAKENIESFIGDLKSIFTTLQESESHYLREENVLFPLIEKHGILGPTKVMWAEHEQIRESKKLISALFDKLDSDKDLKILNQIKSYAVLLQEQLSNHFAKENQILFSMAMRAFSADDWNSVRTEFDEIGYWEVTPSDYSPADKPEQSTVLSDGMIHFPTGKLSTVELNGMLNALPVDITFVDANDEFRYFSQTSHPIFVRSKASVGTNVRNCHPPKSLYKVEQILADFKAGTRDSADFWIHMGERYVLIRYFPVRDENGKYLGTMEVTQDIIPIQSITGERRLLD